MTAIVEKDKNPYQHASSHHSQRQSDPIGILLSNRVERQGPKDAIRNKRVEELPQRFAEIRMRVLTDGLIPSRFGHFSEPTVISLHCRLKSMRTRKRLLSSIGPF